MACVLQVFIYLFKFHTWVIKGKKGRLHLQHSKDQNLITRGDFDIFKSTFCLVVFVLFLLLRLGHVIALVSFRSSWFSFPSA